VRIIHVRTKRFVFFRQVEGELFSGGYGPGLATALFADKRIFLVENRLCECGAYHLAACIDKIDKL